MPTTCAAPTPKSFPLPNPAVLSANMQIRLAHASDLPQLKAISQADASAAHWTQQQWLDIFHSQIPMRLAWIAEEFEAGMNRGPWDFSSPNADRSGSWKTSWYRLNSVAGESATHSCPRCSLKLVPGRLKRILLEVRASNHAAKRLYLRAGFQPLSRRRDYYLNPTEDALILVHSLQ